MEGEKKAKLCFSIPSKARPPKPTTPPAAFSVAAANPGPAPRFVTVFDPSETLTPAAAAPVVIAPLPDSRKPSPAAAAPAAPVVIAPLPNTRKLAEASAGGAPAFVLGSSDNPSSSAGYGLTVRNTDSKRKLDFQDDAAREQPPLPGPSGEDLMLRRFKEDMAVLPEIQGTDEYDEVPVEGFGAALLAGYGWKEGDPIGKKYKGMGAVKVREHGRRRCGTQGIGS